MSEHQATFTWGAGPDSVHISGGFNNWSANASPLHKQADGTFKGEIALPWGEKQAFKYVVDGEWKVREDEAKEWDAAGNMNNVYTAPHAPAKTESSAAPVAAAASSSTPAASTLAPASAERSVEAAPVSAHKTEPSTLLASAAPAAVSTTPAESSTASTTTTTHSNVLGSFGLGAPIGGAVAGALGGAAAGRATTASHPALGASAPPTAVLPATPATTQTTTTAPSTLDQSSITKSASPAEAIERTAAKANVGEAATAPHEDSILEKASAIGATALAGIGAYVGAAAVAVEKATGVDLTHGQPLTIEEAKAAGVDLNRIEKRDGPTDTTSPVGTKPPSAAIDDLDRKIQDLKVGSSSEAAKVEQHTNDIPAQSEATNDHKTVPMPVITPISDKDPKKDRSIEGASAANSSSPKPITADPSISAKVAKVEAEKEPTTTGATLSQANSGSASAPVAGAAATGPLSSGAVVSPNTPAANTISTAEQEAKLRELSRKEASAEKASVPARETASIEKSSVPAKDTTHESAKPTPVVGLVNTTSVPATTPTTPATAPTAPSAAVVVPTAAAPAAAPVAAPVVVAPSTPTKATTVAQNGTPSSIQTTPASTPVKTAHGKEATSGSDVRKRKSSIFHKIKSAFSPKDKEKK